ncbi:SGNH/GDSL hydrolase family protein [Paraliobacillus ryukyuensis]|uniref:SGNH/GDSL hydrolase family protein n=1 Tax=Paraliobacillus ryukyuensis TaxID=200904 RepID=UPI0009A57B95|nr:SGNH/GDSL hydrolase family protein [Paraliobacillus ryukyuensis]
MAVPTNIEELAHDVRNAIYGSQVREAIASSMEATADVADWARQVAQDIVDGKFDEGLLATEIENKLTQLEQDYAPTLTALETEITDARGSYDDLASRLLDITSNVNDKVGQTEYNQFKDDTNAELAEKAQQIDLENTNNSVSSLKIQKADTSYVDNKVSQVQSGVRGTFSTLTELESVYPSGDTGNYVVSSDGHIYNWNGSDWIDTGIQYQSTGLADGSVTKEKTDFFIRTRNLFNKATASIDTILDSSNGNTGYHVSHDTSDFIEIEPSTAYVKNVRGHVAWYDVDKNFISFVNQDTAEAGVSLTSPSNAYFVRFTINKSVPPNSIEIAQWELGTNTTDYQPFRRLKSDLVRLSTESYEDKSVTIDKVDFVKLSRNLFNKNTVTSDAYPDPSFNGTLVSNTNHDASDYIAIQPNTTYVKNVEGHVAFYDENKVFISGINQSTAQADVSFTSPEGAYYVRFSIRKSAGYSIETTQFEVGATPTDYVPFGKILDEDKVILPYSGIDNNKIIDVYNKRKHQGKIMNMLGDSITYHFPLSFIKDVLGLTEIRDYGVSGTTLSSNGTDGMVDRYDSMDDGDIIHVMGGTNDFGQEVPLGTFESTDPTNFRGALRTLIEGLVTKYPDKIIVFSTLPPRYHTNQDATNGYNASNQHPREFAEATREICQEYAIPVIDIFANAGWSKNNRDVYIPDGVHPSSEGYKKIANLIISKLNEL